MEELRKHYSSLSFHDVRSYIQSGNLVFESEESDQRKIENLISEKIKEVYGYDVSVIVREKEEWQQIMANNPFKKEAEDISFLHVSLISDIPAKNGITEILKMNVDSDQVAFVNKEMYLYTSNGIRNTRFIHTMLEKKIKQNVTYRNWKTMMKIHEMLNRD